MSLIFIYKCLIFTEVYQISISDPDAARLVSFTAEHLVRTELMPPVLQFQGSFTKASFQTLCRDIGKSVYVITDIRINGGIINTSVRYA